MFRPRTVVLAFILWVCSGVTLAFVIGDGRSDEDSDLSDALYALERQRRQLANGDRFPYYMNSDPGEIQREKFPSNPFSDNDRADKISLNELYSYLHDSNDGNQDDGLTATPSGELEDIFEGTEVENNKPDKLEKKDDKEGTSQTDSKLIAEASKLMPPPRRETRVQEKEDDEGDSETDESDEESNEPSDVERVSKEELNSLFDGNGGDENEDAAPNDNELGGELQNEEQQTFNGVENIPDYWKEAIYEKKRMAKRGASFGDVIDEKDQTIMDLKEKVERLEIKEQLEDKEINLLADALDKVTRGDLMGEDDNTRSEYGDLQRAIEIEEALSSLDEIDRKASLKDHTAVTALDFIENEPEDLFANKRGEPDYKHKKSSPIMPVLEDQFGRWYNRPITNEEIEEDNYPVVQRRDEDPVGGGMLDDITEEDIKEAIHTLKPWEKVALASKLDQLEREEEEEQEPEPEMECPDVSTFTTDCAFADKMGVFMDDEARELCNRHEICYTCGATIGLTVYKCDAGYLGDAVGACGAGQRDRQTHCIGQAEYFLASMREAHFFNKHKNPLCSNVCIKDFILGVST